MNGIINVIKPPSMSSNGVTVYLRKILNEKKVGHAGTLDPGAAGVLVIMLGKSTRLSDILMGHKKTYVARVRFGRGTDTLDSYGKATETGHAHITEEEMRRTAEGFLGEIEQTPPGYSAIKINGEKAYELARKGKEFEIPRRKISIDSIDILEKTREDEYLLRIVCSKGTYIRTLLHDMGQALGTTAYTSLLIRESSGSFHIKDAWTLDEIEEMVKKGDDSFIIRNEECLEEFDLLKLPSGMKDDIDNGRTLNYMDCRPETELFKVYVEEEFYGLGTDDNGHAKLKIYLKEN